MQSKSLRHLYLSDNALAGPLPEFSPDSALQLLFLRNQVRTQADVLSMLVAVCGQPMGLNGKPARRIG
jgi:hypothetical protein